MSVKIDPFSILIAFVVGFVAGIFANFIYGQLCLKLRKKKGEYLPKILRDTESWKTSDGEIYFYEKDPNYNIKICPGRDVLAERFKKFPDRENDRASLVKVKFNNAVLFSCNFMYLDGYRNLIPIPESGTDPEGSSYDYYNLDSLIFKVFNIIGFVDSLFEVSKLEGLKNIAKERDIAITKI